MANILIVDDDEMLLEMLTEQLGRSGYQAQGANTLAEGVEKALTGNYDVVFLDVQLPDGNGLKRLPYFKEVPSAPEVIIITGKGDEDGAEKAILSGAWSYIEKPDVIKELILHLTRALQYRDEKQRAGNSISLNRDAIIGKSHSLNRCLDRVAQAAVSDASVLITGETGTGKELFARAIHENSNRSHKSFITIDCAALPENLVESMLFGHAKGAFTGADSKQDGLVSLADGGTLFLDEVGELSLSIQKIFLRVLQEQCYRPVGSTVEKTSDFRIVAATNRDIKQCVQDGSFRSDLMYRLNAFSFHIPPLRDRKDDIKYLFRYFMLRLCERSQVDSKGVSPDFLDHLIGYDWPGNVRELQQTMEQVFAYATRSPTLFATHLPEHFRIRQAKAAIQQSSAHCPDMQDESRQIHHKPLPWKSYRSTADRQYIIHLMAYAQGNITAACEISGLSRTRLYQLRGKYL